MAKNIKHKEIKQDIPSCEYCMHFTKMWRVVPASILERMFNWKKKYRNKKDVYICGHPCVFLLELPNLIVAEQGDDIKDIPFPKFCPLKDKPDQGVKVGTTVAMVRNKKISLGERGEDCETGKNMYAFAGGRMDYGEKDPKWSLVREIEEETGLIIKEEDLEFLCISNEFFPEDGKHYVSLVYILYLTDNMPEPISVEGDGKCKGWEWFDPDDIPENTLKCARKTINKYKHKIIK